MINWINDNFRTNYTETDLNEIKNFTLLWNIYENIFFDKSFSIEKLDRVINRSNFEFTQFQECYNYFQNRYIVNNSINERFKNLNFRRNDRMSFVQDIMLGELSNDNDKILATGIIVFRLRNNLFHGEKDYRNLNGQLTNFTNANLYLMQFMTVR